MKPALLVIDVQNEYFAPHGKVVLPDGEAALGQIQHLIEAARRAAVPVIHIVHERLGDDAAVFRRGSVGAEMHPSITPRADEPVLLKHVPGAFTGTSLELRLRDLRVDTVIVSGYMTFMCCDTTARQARERNFDVLFAADATAARDLALNGRTVPHAAVQDATLAVMTNFAGVRTAAEIVALLDPAPVATPGAAPR